MFDKFRGSIQYKDDIISIIPDELPFFEEENIKLTSLHIDNHLLKKLKAPYYNNKIIRFVGSETSLLYFLDLVELLSDQQKIHHELRIKLLLQRFFKAIELSNNTKIFTGAQIKILQDHIFENLQEPLRIQELSRIMGMNQQYFKIKFKNTFDTSVHDYIKNQRLNKALQMIQENEYPLSIIAFKVGYSSLSSFSQAFKNHFDSAPSIYKISKN